jgi:hypothetical protein
MHADMHLQLHEARATELRREAAGRRPPRPDLRTQLGRMFVELGLRLVQRPPARAARIA